MPKLRRSPASSGAVAHAVVQDVSATWEQYERVTAPTIDPAPKGLILHVAGPTDDGFRVIDVWESRDAWGRFHADRVAPALSALGGPARPEPTLRDLHPGHLVVGDRFDVFAEDRQTAVSAT